MRVLVLGAYGQLGSDLMREGHERATVYSINGWGREQLDLAQIDDIASSLSNVAFDVLINCTGYHNTDEVEDHAERAFIVNAEAVQRLAAECARRGADFVHLSTDFVFDGAGQRPYREQDPRGPINIYGASKAMGETLALQSCTNTWILRVASLFGTASAHRKRGNFVETMLRLGRERGVVEVVDDIVMSPTASRDVAQWIFCLLEKRPRAGVYHAVNSGAASWSEFAHAIFKGARVAAEILPVSTEHYASRARRPRYSALDNSALAQVVGPIRPWQLALQDYLARAGHAAMPEGGNSSAILERRN